jgi:uncharacterized protein (DUF58 family)
MTPRAVVLLLMASATLFAAANVGVGWLYALGFLFVAYLLFSYLLAFLAIAGVRVSVRAGTSAEAGGTLPVVVTLENPGRSPRSFLSVIAPPVGEVIPGWMRWMRGPLFPEDWGFAVASEVPPHGSASVSLPVPTPRRGLYRLPDFLLQAPAHGLGAVQRRVPTDSLAVVHPRIRPLPELPWFRPSAGGDRSATRLVPTATGELVRAVREYRSGDALKSVHWRATAKTGELRIKESEGERPVGSIAIGLDLGPGYDEESFEHALSVVASLLAYGDRLGLPVRVRSQQGAPLDESLSGQLDWLARLRIDDQTIDDAPPAGFPHPSGEGAGGGGSATVGREPGSLQDLTILISARPAQIGQAEVCLFVGPGPTPAGMIACSPGDAWPATLGGDRRGR